MVKPFSFGDKGKESGRRKKKAEKREDKKAKETGGAKQPMSGGFKTAGGDVRESPSTVLSTFLWDDKFTENKSFRITLEMWEKLRDEAYSQNNLPALEIAIDPPRLKEPLELVVLEKEDFEELRQNAKKGEDNNE